MIPGVSVDTPNPVVLVFGDEQVAMAIDVQCIWGDLSN
jgi:hypothetical protein